MFALTVFTGIILETLSLMEDVLQLYVIPAQLLQMPV